MYLVGFQGHAGHIVVDAASSHEAVITAFKHFKVPQSSIRAEEREDAWDHINNDLPARRDGASDPVVFLRANPAPVE